MSGAINFKGKLPEANIQAEFYHHCRLLGVPCILEYITPAGRHDACIFTADFENLLAVVECKNHVIHPNSKQLTRYAVLGVPVYTLLKMIDAEQLASSIFAMHLAIPSKIVPVASLCKITPIPLRTRQRRSRVHYIDIDEDLIIRQ